MNENLLKTSVITPNGIYKHVKGHDTFVLNYLKSINKSFDKLKEEDITKNIKTKVFKKGFIRISEFKDIYAVQIFKPITLNQTKCLIKNISIKEKYIIEEKYESKITNIFIDIKDFINYLIKVTEKNV